MKRVLEICCRTATWPFSVTLLFRRRPSTKEAKIAVWIAVSGAKADESSLAVGVTSQSLLGTYLYFHYLALPDFWAVIY